ncbi:26S protease regulatory subunit 6b, partial [Trifolium pratense]
VIKSGTSQHPAGLYSILSGTYPMLSSGDDPKLALTMGPRMVRDVFRLAKENAPAIIFIDEVDAIATARFDAQTGADREVQRILMELLNQVLMMNIDLISLSLNL